MRARLAVTRQRLLFSNFYGKYTDPFYSIILALKREPHFRAREPGAGEQEKWAGPCFPVHPRVALWFCNLEGLSWAVDVFAVLIDTL